MCPPGWNAVKNRVQQLGLELNDDQVKEVTAQIKQLADVRPQSIEDVDLLLKNYHRQFNDDSKMSTKDVHDTVKCEN